MLVSVLCISVFLFLFFFVFLAYNLLSTLCLITPGTRKLITKNISYSLEVLEVNGHVNAPLSQEASERSSVITEVNAVSFRSGVFFHVVFSHITVQTSILSLQIHYKYMINT